MPTIEEELRKEIRKFVISTSFWMYSYHVNSTGEFSRKISKFNFMFDIHMYEHKFSGLLQARLCKYYFSLL